MKTDSPVDLRALLKDLKTLVDIESPSTDLAAISRVMNVVEGWARDLSAETRALPGGTREMNFGVQEGKKYILVLAHVDTVWPHRTLQGMPWREDGDRVYGPGTYDMKAGIVGLFHALRSFNKKWPEGGIRLMVTPDEEIGSPTSRGHIEQAAKGARAVLVVEPPVADSHHLKTGRKGTGQYIITFTGIASHAGNKPSEGASAITAAAEAVLALQGLARPDVGTTISVGKISGGTATNVVPAECSIDIDLRVSTISEAERVDKAIHGWKPGDRRVKVSIKGGLNRPPFEQSPGTLALYEKAKVIAADLGFELGHEVVGGGSDGNFTAPIAPTLDGLGSPGDGAHASHEHVRLDRWPDHVQLLTRLIQEV